MLEEMLEVEASGEGLGDRTESDQTSRTFSFLVEEGISFTKLAHELKSEDVHFVTHGKEVDVL